MVLNAYSNIDSKFQNISLVCHTKLLFQSVRNGGIERWWWHANCPKISNRRKTEFFFFTLILLPCWVRYLLIMVRSEWVSHPSAEMAAEQGASRLCREASWVHYCSKARYTAAMEWAQSGDCISVASGTACCALLRPNDMHMIRPPYLFPCFFKISLPWSFLLNGLLEAASSNPNHTRRCSNIVLAEVTSTEQEQACWHFVSLCSRPSICFSLTRYKLKAGSDCWTGQ